MEEMWLARNRDGKVHLFIDEVAPKKNYRWYMGSIRIFSYHYRNTTCIFPTNKWVSRKAY